MERLCEIKAAQLLMAIGQRLNWTFATLTTPAMQKNTATNLENVNLSPLDDGYRAANINVKNVDVELNSKTSAVSLGSNANWNR